MNEKKQKPGFMTYFDTRQAVEQLTDEQAGRLFKACYGFAEDGTEPDFTDDLTLKIVWGFFGTALRRDNDRYFQIRKRNKLNALYGAYKSRRMKAGKDFFSYDQWLENGDAERAIEAAGDSDELDKITNLA